MKVCGPFKEYEQFFYDFSKEVDKSPTEELISLLNEYRTLLNNLYTYDHTQ